jgi:cytochrome c oxidase assembly protein subunit 15
VKKAILVTGKISLVLVFLVVLAGSVVRMTGSGMGCPDWPKCFGYFIPPTDEAQLIWKPDHAYQKGQMILGDDEFLVARTNFTSGQEFNHDHWRVYDKHDYAIFNPVHTWIEYINRLFGALSGIPVLLLFVLAAFYLRKDLVTFILSAAALFSLGFAAWLGKLVVDGNLIPHSITYHMFSAVVLILLLVAVVYRHQSHPVYHTTHVRKLGWLAFTVVVLSLIQVYLGTNVREQVDAMGNTIPRGQWIAELDVIFLIHRSFSVIVLAVNAYFIWLLLQAEIKVRLAKMLAVLIAAVVLAGVLLNYAGFPAAMQPVHLLLAIFIIAIQFYLGLQFWWRPRVESVAA